MRLSAGVLIWAGESHERYSPYCQILDCASSADRAKAEVRQLASAAESRLGGLPIFLHPVPETPDPFLPRMPDKDKLPFAVDNIQGISTVQQYFPTPASLDAANRHNGFPWDIYSVLRFKMLSTFSYIIER